MHSNEGPLLHASYHIDSLNGTDRRPNPPPPVRGPAGAAAHEAHIYERRRRDTPARAAEAGRRTGRHELAQRDRGSEAQSTVASTTLYRVEHASARPSTCEHLRVCVCARLYALGQVCRPRIVPGTR